MQVLRNISRSQGNQTMTFGQLIEYNMSNNFFEKSYTNVTEKLVVHTCGSTDRNFMQFTFIVCPNGGLQKFIQIKLLNTCFCLIYKAFMKNKKGLELISLAHFLHGFSKKNISHDKWRVFIGWLALLFEISGNMFMVIICVLFFDIISLILTIAFLSSRFPAWSKGSGQRFKYLNSEKRFLDEIRGTFDYF